MKIQNMILVVALFGSLSAKADFNEECKFAYRGAATDILTAIEGFRDGQLNSADLALGVGAVNTAVKTLRLACHFAESGENTKCVIRYGEIYKNLKDKVKVFAMLVGNQQNVSMGFLEPTAIKAKIALADLACGYSGN